MNAFIVALTVTLMALLDYCWPHVERSFSDARKAGKVRGVVIIGILLFVWVQAVIQFKQDAESDSDMTFLKEQLSNANKSLTNSTDVIRGLTTGGDSTVEFSVSQTDDTNTIQLLMHSGEFPLRGLYVKIKDTTHRMNRDRNSTPSAADTLLFERNLGDYPAKTFGSVGNVILNPSVTNYLRFDVSALNGSYWQIWAISKTNDNWIAQLHYRWNEIGGRPRVEPASKKGILMIDD